MKNQTSIKGDKNIVVQDVNTSKIDINSANSQNKKNKLYTIIGLAIAALTLIAAIIVGWDNILKFFQK